MSQTMITNGRAFLKRLVSQRQLVWMSVPVVLYVVLFTYVPLWGWTIAFQNYRPSRPFDQQQWVGLAWFRELFSDAAFLRVMRNTLAMSLINLVLSFFGAIGLALLVNEVTRSGVKRVVQTISYLPHFLSWVVVAALVTTMLASNGPVNALFEAMGIIREPVLWLGEPRAFWWIIGASHVWKDVGWNSIIYLAAIAAIDPHLYEAAQIDGANRYQRIAHVTLPGIRPTVVVLLIISIGYLMESGFEAQYQLRNGMNQDFAQSIDIFVVDYGLKLGRYSMATASGMFKSVVAILLLLSANAIAHRLGQERLV